MNGSGYNRDVPFLKSIPGYPLSKLNFYLMSQQGLTGFKFDTSLANNLINQIDTAMEEIRNEIEPSFPERPLKKVEEPFYTIPMKPFKKDGRLSKKGEEFISKHNLELIGKNHIQWKGQLIPLKGGTLLPATAKTTLSNSSDVKKYLMDQGWKPTLWNVKKDQRGRPVRENGKLIKTSPKLQENGVLCENLEKIAHGTASKIVKWLSLSNRKGVISGWLSNQRLGIDGCLPAESKGLAATHRQRHKVVVNVPKADPKVLLGRECRQLFRCRKGRILVGWDASALEARVEAHYTYPYEGGEQYAHDLLDGDPHLRTCAEVFHNEIGHLIGTERWNADDPEVKSYRSLSKNIRYACSYGAQVPKICSMMNVSKAEGERIFNGFWRAALPLKQFKDALEKFWETEGGKQFIVGIDGRKLFSRSKHSLVNLCFQSCGAIIMDLSGAYMNKWLGGIKLDVDGVPHYLYKGSKIYRVCYNHDEYVYDCEDSEELTHELGEMGVRSISYAGRLLKLRVPLTGEAKVGPTWADIH